MEKIRNHRAIEDDIINNKYTGVLYVYNSYLNHMDKFILKLLNDSNIEYNKVDIMLLSNKVIKLLDPNLGINLFIIKDSIILEHIREYNELTKIVEILEKLK